MPVRIFRSITEESYGDEDGDSDDDDMCEIAADCRRPDERRAPPASSGIYRELYIISASSTFPFRFANRRFARERSCAEGNARLASATRPRKRALPVKISAISPLRFANVFAQHNLSGLESAGTDMLRKRCCASNSHKEDQSRGPHILHKFEIVALCYNLILSTSMCIDVQLHNTRVVWY